eukprot:COSAG01_NODE_93_length_27013_cov_41.515791_6_plen_319_part_00
MTDKNKNQKRQAAVKICGLKKTYQQNFEALKGINLSIPKGSFYGLLGPNGAGKSTLIGILSGLVSKSSGQIHVLGKDSDQDSQLTRSYLGVVPQEFNFNIFEPCIQIICNHAGYYGVPRQVAIARADIYLKKLGLWDKRNVAAGQLSGGLKRRLMIVRALVHQPKILILDEPTAGVDIALRHLMWEFLEDLNKAGMTIVLTTHYLEEAEKLCKHLAIIDKGELLADGPTESLLNNLNKERIELQCQPFEKLPKIAGARIQQKTEQANNYILDVELEKGSEVTAIIEALKAQGIQVKRWVNQVNRLEELFLDLVAPVNV